jgi:hypothetical protein
MKRQKRTFKERLRIIKIKFLNNWIIALIRGWVDLGIRLITFRLAKSRARKWSRRTNGKRFYVIPDSKYGFAVLNNFQRKAYNRKVAKHRRISYKLIDALAYWNTGLKKETQPPVIKVKKSKTKKK